MSFDEFMLDMQAAAFEEYGDGFFQSVLGAGSEYDPAIFAEFQRAVDRSPYQVFVKENGHMAFRHQSGHVVTSHPFSVRKKPIAVILAEISGERT
ncbi:hypothetical protein HFO61_30320 [Rhizobium leguminosarum]|uniref:hypothetical protein n=1 Tax=Rhizobium leguminosarum TaxID=384 RepID=UPI00103D08E7|nr:hypothetical protein [Rhizobium leguminosarum]MBY5551043.1 hypothetical protein [Rhizobium leguminosarum]TCB60201.1 hypothetical protein E0J20_09415 [Rhizobium leguminosarum bv. viciae]